MQGHVLPSRSKSYLDHCSMEVCDDESPIHEMAQIVRDHIKDPESEIEFRLGTREDGKWKSNLGFKFQDKILSQSGSMDKPRKGSLVFTRWSERCDHYHSGMRTRMNYDGDECRVVLEHIRKIKVRRAQFDVGDTGYSIRLDVSREQKVDEQEIPDYVNSDSVHLIQYCTAEYTSRHGGQKMWRYDLSMRWKGATRAEAELKQRAANSSPEYTIELEYIGTANMVEQYGAQRLVVTGIAKMLDIIDGKLETLSNFKFQNFTRGH